VRDLHAHLWVEAFLLDAPDDAATGQSGPRWVTLDPTPAARDVIVQTQEQDSQSAWVRLQTSWQSLWAGSIRMNQFDQQSLIYGPIQDAAESLGRQALLAGRGLRFARLRGGTREWFSWQGGLAAFVLLLCVAGLVAAARRGLRRWRRGRRTVQSAAPPRLAIPFYERLEALLVRHGLGRAPEQTPREFVHAAESILAVRVPPALQPVPRLLTEAFYAARYGGAALNPREVEAAERRLDEFERELDADALRREGLPQGG
jgi:hypothetical protein